MSYRNLLAVLFLPLLFARRYPRSIPIPLTLYCPTVDFRFVGYITRVDGPGLQGTPFLSGIIVP